MSRDVRCRAERPTCLTGLVVHAVGSVASLEAACAAPWHLSSGMRMIIERHSPGCRTLWLTAEDVDCMACIAAECR